MVKSNLLLNRLSFAILAIVTLTAVPTMAQNKTFGAKPILPTVQITMHRADTNSAGEVVFLGENKIKVLEALSPEKIENGFADGEKVVIRIKSPNAFYAYIVNYSDKDGINLVYPFNDNTGQNREFKANTPTDFAYSLSSDEVDNPVREEFFVLISSTKIDSPKLDSILNNNGKIELTKKEKAEVEKEIKKPDETKASGDKKKPDETKASDDKKKKCKGFWCIFKKVGCVAAGVVHPYAGNVCTQVFGAKPIFRKDGKIQMVPTKGADKMAFRLSFEVKKSAKAL